mmetsp:Transcript_3044/g.5199  ORF Transcript_3044/g.5199 Transcript_3044/m.5199 type:complete len:179 (-) Transcript_3044:96-632(-)
MGCCSSSDRSEAPSQTAGGEKKTIDNNLDGVSPPSNNGAFGELVGDVLLKNSNGETIRTDQALADKVVGIYFSAHWCPPCRGFTPRLAEFYNQMKESGKNFEVVFVSSDQNEAAFNDYFKEMPWLAVPFSDRNLKQKLSENFGVRGIPTLVILDQQANTITLDGRSKVMNEGSSFPWK